MSNQNSEDEILSIIDQKYKLNYVKKKDLPKPFYNEEEKSKVKAIILGCDPTIEEIVTLGEDVYFDKVFGLGAKGKEFIKVLKDRSYDYFYFIRNNLKILEMNVEKEIYVQNICKNYLTMETGK